jgi:predicted DNA-binding transcriptional regulator YafY
MYKIQSVLRTTDKEYLEQLLPNVHVTPSRIPAAEPANEHLAVLQRAIAEKKLLFIRYQTSLDIVTERLVEPVGLWHYSQHWHLIGWCRLRHGYRDFRVSRMQQLQLKEETFLNRSYDSLKEYVNSRADTAPLLKEMVILFNKEDSHYVVESKYQQGFVKQEDLGDKIRMHFLSPHTEYFGRWLLMYSNSVSIEWPSELSCMMESLVEELVQHYLVK